MESNPRNLSARSLVWLAVALLGGLAALAVLPVDQACSDAMRAIDLPGDLHKAINLSEVFGHSFGATAILSSLLLVARERRKALWGAVVLTAAAGITANLSKGTIARVRPHSVGLIEVLSEKAPAVAEVSGTRPTAVGIERVSPSFWDSRQRSFPSGHSATAWGLALGLSLVFPRGAVLFALFALLACLQRVFSGAHYPSDVLAGAAIAFLWGAGLTSIPAVRGRFQATPG